MITDEQAVDPLPRILLYALLAFFFISPGQAEYSSTAAVLLNKDSSPAVYDTYNMYITYEVLRTEVLYFLLLYRSHYESK